MAQVYGAGGKTQPKRGRNGTGSYWPDGTPLYKDKGNVFPGINVVRPNFVQIAFGSPSRAGIASVVGQNRAQTPSNHPNQSFYNTITQPLAPAMVVSSSNEDKNLAPVPPRTAVLIMPHERNMNSASGSKKKPQTFRTTFGASKSMPVDTAFVRNIGATYKHTERPDPKPAIEAVKRSSLVGRTFARVQKPTPTATLRTAPRTPPPSFVSRGNHWFDPHNSFIAGHTTTAGQGVGRWGIVKRGVVQGIRERGRHGGL